MWCCWCWCILVAMVTDWWGMRKCCWCVEAHLTILVLDVMVMKLRDFRKDIDIIDEELYDRCLHDDIVSMEVCLLSDSLMDSKLEHSPSLTLHLSFSLLFSSPPFFAFLLSSSPFYSPIPFRSFLPARRYASAGYRDRNVSVCLSICLSVCPSRAGIVSKRRKLAAWFLHHLVAPRL